MQLQLWHCVSRARVPVFLTFTCPLTPSPSICPNQTGLHHPAGQAPGSRRPRPAGGGHQRPVCKGGGSSTWDGVAGWVGRNACRAGALLLLQGLQRQQPAVQLACPCVSVPGSLLALHPLPPCPPPCSSPRRCTSQSRRLGRRWRRAPRCSASCWPARRWAAGVGWVGCWVGVVELLLPPPCYCLLLQIGRLHAAQLSHHASLTLLPRRRSARSGSCASWPSRRAWTGWVARPPRQVRTGVVLCL